MPATLSVCTIALNEADLIGDMLHSVARLADEIVVGVDSRTTDRTAEIAQNYWAVTFPFVWLDDFSAARNLTLLAATSGWCLVIDADERLTPAGAEAIREIINGSPDEPKPDAVTGIAFLMAQTALDGTQHGTTLSSIRLFRNRSEIRYRGCVHEEPWWIPDPALTTAAIVRVVAFEHVGYDPALWYGRQKRERNIRLLEHRVAADPTDRYAAAKLERQIAETEPWVNA